MTPEQFVRQVRKNIVDHEIQFYRDALTTSKQQEVTDPYWNALIGLFDCLDTSQQLVLLQLVRQVSVDTVAALFGLIDGVCCFEGMPGDFSFTANGEAELAGDLQEWFLIQEHEEGRK